MDQTGSAIDQRLIALLGSGELTALDTLFSRHSRAIYGFLYRTTGSVTTAEDLTQEIFIRVLRYHSGFRPGSAFRPWLYGIARNVLSDHRTRSQPEANIEELKLEPVSDLPPPSSRIERNENQRLMHAALARLSETERELLVLSRFEDLRHAELAEIFGCTTGAVKVRVHRALKRLAVAFETVSAEVPK